jgi:hypothetical protein
MSNPIDLRASPATDPTPIYRYRDGLYAADLLGCAIVYLDFFTWLADNPSTKQAICEHFAIHERPTDVMLTLLRAMGLVTVDNSKFAVTENAREHLVKSSPWHLGPYYASLKERPVCKDFLQVLRTDKPANWGSYKDEKDWTRAMEDPAFAESFTAAMDCRGVFLSQAAAKALDLSDRRQLLDIAGGSGIYACSLVAHHSNLTAAVFEKPPVDKVAASAIGKRGYSEKVRVIAGDMFKEDLPGGFDVHLFSNVLHDWNTATVDALLRKSHSALARRGLLVIHDVHINEEKSGPLPNAAYSALLMHATEGKCYSLAELFPLLRTIGFDQLTFVPTAADRSVVTAIKG